MNFFINIKSSPTELSFELINKNIKLGFANALRRIIISEISVVAIDKSSIIFRQNSSMLHDDILLKRLILMPIDNSKIKEYDINNIEFDLKKTNDTDHMMNIFSKDFLFRNEGHPIENLILDDNILFGKLKPNQELEIYGKLKKNNAKNGGAEYCTTNRSTVIFKQDENLLKELTKNMDKNEAEIFKRDQGDFYYMKNKQNEPSVYIFNIESLGVLEPKIIFHMALEKLKDKLNYIIYSLENDITEKILIERSEKLYESYNFKIIDENDTLGNLLNTYIQTNPNIHYSGYLIPHPNDNKLLITTALKNNNTIENNKKIFIDNIKNIIVIVNDLLSEWETIMNIKPIKKTIKVKKI